MPDQTLAVALPFVAPADPAAVPRPCLDCGQILAVGAALALALAADRDLRLCCPACVIDRCKDSDTVIGVTLNLRDTVH